MDLSGTKKLISENGPAITKLQKALLSSLGLLVHMTFLFSSKRTTIPTNKILVPEISSVARVLSGDSEFIHLLCNLYIDTMMKRNRFQKYFKDEPLFQTSNIEALKTLMNVLISAEAKRLPNIIGNKFTLNKGIGVFYEKPGHGWKNDIFNEHHVAFIVDESILQMIALTMTPYEINIDHEFTISENVMVSIFNKVAIDTLYLDTNVLSNNPVMETIKFVNGITSQRSKDSFNINIHDTSSKLCWYLI